MYKLQMFFRCFIVTFCFGILQLLKYGFSKIYAPIN